MTLPSYLRAINEDPYVEQPSHPTAGLFTTYVNPRDGDVAIIDAREQMPAPVGFADERIDWKLVYDSSDEDYPWHYAGGPPLIAVSEHFSYQEAKGENPQDFIDQTASAILYVPLAGEYRILLGAHMLVAHADPNLVKAIAVAAPLYNGVTYEEGHGVFFGFKRAAANMSNYREVAPVTLNAGGEVRLRYSAKGAGEEGMARFWVRWVGVVPIRVSAI